MIVYRIGDFLYCVRKEIHVYVFKENIVGSIFVKKEKVKLMLKDAARAFGHMRKTNLSTMPRMKNEAQISPLVI